MPIHQKVGELVYPVSKLHKVREEEMAEPSNRWSCGQPENSPLKTQIQIQTHLINEWVDRGWEEPHSTQTYHLLCTWHCTNYRQGRDNPCSTDDTISIKAEEVQDAVYFHNRSTEISKGRDPWVEAWRLSKLISWLWREAKGMAYVMVPRVVHYRLAWPGGRVCKREAWEINWTKLSKSLLKSLTLKPLKGFEQGNYIRKHLKKDILALAGLSQWIEGWPAD